MRNRMLILSLVSSLVLISPAFLHAQDDDVSPVVRSRVESAEFDLKMQELELMVAELAIEEARVEYEKARIHLDIAKSEDDPRAADFAELEVKQAAINIESQTAKREMVRLRVDRLRASFDRWNERLEQQRSRDERDRGRDRDGRADEGRTEEGRTEEGRTEEGSADNAPVQVELLEDLGVVMLTGAEADVERVEDFIENNAFPKQQPAEAPQIKIFALQHGVAMEYMRIIRELYPVETNGLLRVACDERTNSVLVRGNADDLAEIEAILLRLDVE